MESEGKKRVVFLSVPESLRGQIESMAHDGHHHNEEEKEDTFSINPDIPIPMEIPAGEEKPDLGNLSWEMILSGMLHVISEEKEKPDWLDYYRGFVLALRPNIMEEFTTAAIIKARNGDFDSALEMLAALRGLFPASAVPRLNRALALEQRAALLEKRNKAEAETALRETAAAYEELLDMEPPFPDALFNGGFFFLEQKDYHRARDCFSRYAGDEIPYPVDDGKKAQAIAIVKEIGKNGLEDERFCEACALLRLQGQETAALSSIRDFLERHPTLWNGWFVLGWALRRLGRWADAAAALQKAVELNAGAADARNELAICLMETGDLSGARRELEAALRQDPENTKIISNLGVLAMKAGNKTEAERFFRTVLELDPDDPVAGKA